MLMHGPGYLVEEGWTVEDGDDCPDHEADEFAGEDCSEVPQGLHFEDSGGELEELHRHRRGHHRRNHDGEKLLLLEAVAKAFIALAIDALQQEELATGAAE